MLHQQKSLLTKASGDRSLLALTSIMLALAAVIALASHSSEKSVDDAPQLLLEEQPVLQRNVRNTAHPALHAHGKRPIPKGKLAKQQLAEAFTSYNKKTGYLINRFVTE